MESETETDGSSPRPTSSIDVHDTVEFPPLKSRWPSAIATVDEKPSRKWGPPPKPSWSTGPFAKRSIAQCYTAIARYKLSRDELRDYGFAMIVPNTQLVHINEPHYYKDNRLVIKDGTRHRVCCRCNGRFVLGEPADVAVTCDFHLRPVYDKIEHVRVFPCCTFQTDNDALKILQITGCYHNTFHVFHHIYDSDLNKFIQFPESGGPDDVRRNAVFALDCEMVYTSRGPALARLSLVNVFGNVVIDVTVRPDGEIYDTNKAYSGLTIEQVEAATETLETVHEKLFKLISRDTILIGHSLEADLRALHLVHENIVDTSVLYLHHRGQRKMSLRELAASHLHREIQSSETNGHDSIEDAVTCLQLVAFRLDCDDETKRDTTAGHLPFHVF